MDRQPRKILSNVCNQRDQSVEYQQTEVRHNGKFRSNYQVSSSKLVLKPRTHVLKAKLDLHEKRLCNTIAGVEAIVQVCRKIYDHLLRSYT